MATISRQYSMLSTSIDNIEQGLLQILTDTDIASLEGSLQHLREVQRSLDRTRQRIASGARAVFQSEADEANEAVIMPTLFDRTLLDRILRGSVDGHPSDLPNQPSHPTTLGEIESIEHLQRDANASSTVKHLISLCRAWTTAQEKLSYDGEVVTLNEATAMAERFPPSWNAHHACKNDPGRRGHQYRADLIEKFETLDPETQFQAADLIFRHGWTWQRAFQTAYDQYKRSLEERRMERMERLEEDRAASAAARESRRRRRQLLRDVQGQLPNERQAQDDAAEATGAAEATEAAQNDEEEGREDLAVLEVPATTAAPQSDTAANSAPHPDDFEDLDSEEEEDMDLQRALAASMETHAAAQFSMTILPAAMETTTTTTRPAQAADGAN